MDEGADSGRPTPARAVGLDVGASRTRALVMHGERGEGARRVGPPAAVDPRQPWRTAEVLEGFLREMEAAGAVTLPVDALCAGVAGAGRREARRELEAALGGAELARQVSVVTDGEVALFDAHGDGPGLLLISGTGSVAWGRNARGEVARAGGWGPRLGDEGSGHAVALAALRRATRAADGREEATGLGPRLLDRLGLERPEELVGWVAGSSRAEIASLAPVVAELAEEGVAPAAEIVEEAAEELVAAVDAVARRLGPWDRPPRLALAGGLLDPGGPLRGRVSEAVQGLDVCLQQAEVDPARGAARMALRRAPEA